MSDKTRLRRRASTYLRRLEEEIRLSCILNDFLEIVDVGMAVETKVCRQQIGARVVRDLKRWEKS